MRSYKTALFIVSVFALLLVFSCKKTVNKTIDFKYGYFPVDTGHYVIYNCDSITYNNFYTPVKIDTVNFQVKEVITSVFLDNTGTPSYRIQGYRRNTPNQPWVVYYTWYSNLYTTSAQKTEEPLRFIKLIFPPVAGNSWSGNSYINTDSTDAFLANWLYTYQNVDVPMQFSNSWYLDSTLTVLQDSSATLIGYIYGKEQYAKNVGLIYKQVAVLNEFDSVPESPSIPWPQRANNGFIYTMTAVSYNK